MAYEIKMLDLIDIELESSFLVLARNMGVRTRVKTWGYLILGPDSDPLLVDTGASHPEIMERLGMTGIVTKEMTIRRQLSRHGVKISDVRWILHTHHHIDHAGQDAQFAMRQTVITNRRELEYSASGIMGGQYPPEYVKHHIDRLHTPGAMRLLDLELSGPDEIAPGIVCEAAGGHTEGSMNILVETAEGHRLHLRGRDLRHPEPGRRPHLPGARPRASIDGQPGNVEAPGTRRDQEGAEQRHLRATHPRLPGPRRARPSDVAPHRGLGAGPRAGRRSSDDRRDAQDGTRQGGVQDPGCRAVTAHVGSGRGRDHLTGGGAVSSRDALRDDERVFLLGEDIGHLAAPSAPPPWNPIDDVWEEHYRALQHFVAREGHARVTFRHVEEVEPPTDVRPEP